MRPTAVAVVVVVVALLAATGSGAQGTSDSEADRGADRQAERRAERQATDSKLADTVADADAPLRKRRRERPTAPDSPRASLTHFLEAARAGDVDGAVVYFEEVPVDAARTVKRLRLILDRGAALPLTEVSPLSAGDDDDGLADGVDEVGELPLPEGLSVPVEVVRVEEPGARWVFSSPTLARVDDAWLTLPHGALIERMPVSLLREGPLGLLRYQWLLLPVILLMAWLLGGLSSRVVFAVLRRITAHTTAHWDDKLFDGLRGPLTMGLTVAAAWLLTPWLELFGRAHTILQGAMRIGLLIAFFWALVRAVDVGVGHLLSSPWSAAQASSRALVPLGGRITKVVVVAVAVIAVVSSFGYPVASLLAGLGIGGLAVALAAQKTFENLFGAFAVGVDQPFREGDFIKVDDFLGTVEAIGLRSTRIRTLDRTLITLPNGQLAEKRIESFAVRDRLRLGLTLTVVHATTSAQLESITTALMAALQAEPKLWPNEVVARLLAIGATGFDIEINAWFDTTDFGEFAAIRTRLLLRFLRIVEESGTRLAYPTRNVLLEPAAPPVERGPAPAP